MDSEDYQMGLQMDRDRICASVREQYAKITAKLASDLLEQRRTSSGVAFESKAPPPRLVPPPITQKCDVGVQTELESVPISKSGSSSKTDVESASSSANLQNVIEQLHGQLAQHEAELARTHSIARALETNLHQREVHLRKLEADCDRLRAEKDMYFWKVFHLEISHSVDMQTLKNANSEVERLREEMHKFHQPSSRLYQSVKNAVERKAKGLPPVLPEILGVTIHGHTAIPGVHTEATTMPPPPPPDAHGSSASQQPSQQPNHLATFAVKPKNGSQNSISIPKGRVTPGPFSAPPVVSAPNPLIVSPIDDGHIPQHQYRAHHVPKRTSTVPLPTNGAHSQGHIMNYIHIAGHQVPHQHSVNHTTPTPVSQPPPTSQPQVANHSAVSSVNPTPTPQPTEVQRQPIGIPINCGNPMADSIFSCLWKSEVDNRHQFVSSSCKGCHSVRLGKDDLLNYQSAFEHSSTAHPDEWHRCCEWVVARIAQQLQPQTLAQPAAPRV